MFRFLVCTLELKNNLRLDFFKDWSSNESPEQSVHPVLQP